MTACAHCDFLARHLSHTRPLRDVFMSCKRDAVQLALLGYLKTLCVSLKPQCCRRLPRNTSGQRKHMLGRRGKNDVAKVTKVSVSPGRSGRVRGETRPAGLINRPLTDFRETCLTSTKRFLGCGRHILTKPRRHGSAGAHEPHGTLAPRDRRAPWVSGIATDDRQACRSAHQNPQASQLCRRASETSRKKSGDGG